MIARTLEELQVYQQAVEIGDAVAAILERPDFRRGGGLTDQLTRSSERVAPLISEGFAQSSDRHFANYLFRARGSCNESRTHLTRAKTKGYIGDREHDDLCAQYVVLGKRLTRLIQHLLRENRKTRG